MPDVEPVKAYVADPGFQVVVDVAAVAVDRGLPDLLRREPAVEPLTDRDAGGDVLAGLESAAGLFDVRQRLLALGDHFQQVTDVSEALVVVLVGNREQCTHLVERCLGVRLRGEAAAPERAPRAVLSGR
ncbi:hypothetical protein RKE29_02940 [Streptomyces sp. B1866]|uniref:hypothetical protein n=1 Tax=Streptomyces sp. B1866 TaxID=3075431 RepID=UPI0028914184|nr:hypothetical protein [Streptomyces sp. B1866]MDT3395616.1 hypothetical protein [Streptomyces sp. B1866]